VFHGITLHSQLHQSLASNKCVEPISFTLSIPAIDIASAIYPAASVRFPVGSTPLVVAKHSMLAYV